MQGCRLSGSGLVGIGRVSAELVSDGGRKEDWGLGSSLGVGYRIGGWGGSGFCLREGAGRGNGVMGSLLLC